MAAFAAHWLINLVGDFALPHDTYDDFGHSSRIGTVVGALAFPLLALLEFLNSVLGESLGGRVMVRSVARTVIRAPWQFGALVVGLPCLPSSAWSASTDWWLAA